YTIHVAVRGYSVHFSFDRAAEFLNQHPLFMAAFGHHAFPRSLFRFLPNSAAKTWLERKFVTGPLDGSHYYNAAHRAYNEGVEDLLNLNTASGRERFAEKVAEKGIEAVRDAGQKILDSDNPAIKNFLDSMTTT